jgi:hypothetical protein
MTKFTAAFRKALATFVFATAGLLVGVNVFDADVAFWQLVASTGIGSLINLAYRWAEAEIKKEG